MSIGFEIALWILLVAASATDLIWGKIYNFLTLPFLCAGLIARAYLGGLPSATVALEAIGVAFIVFFPLYVLKVFAAGDVKLLMAIGAWTTPMFIVRLGIFSILVGAVVGAFVVWKQKGFKKGGTRMPFAPAFLCGVFLIKVFELKGWSIL